MPRVNVWLPQALFDLVRAQLPEVNVSQLLQEALRGALACQHEQLACAQCAQPIDRWAMVDERMNGFFSDAMWALIPLVDRGATAEGAARVLKDVAQRWRIPAANRVPLPRPSRAARRTAKVREMPTEAESRQRHPTARAEQARTNQKPVLNEEIA